MMAANGLKRVLLAASVGVPAALMSAGAYALPDADTAFEPGGNIISDDSAELFIDVGGNSATAPDVGDIFVGALVITTITATSIIFEIAGPILCKLGLQKAGEIPTYSSKQGKN